MKTLMHLRKNKMIYNKCANDDKILPCRTPDKFSGFLVIPNNLFALRKFFKQATQINTLVTLDS